MRLRPYIASRDYRYIEKWVGDERTHVLWCANRIPYPMAESALHDLLREDAEEWEGCAYIATEDDGTPVGFFVYSVNVENNEGFLKFIIVDGAKRGRGYGVRMLRLALQYAFEITGAEAVYLNVFDVNESAMKCYANAGFVEQEGWREQFAYRDEVWGRRRMAVTRRLTGGIAAHNSVERIG